jgi:polar amino acid transport system ATP-binding protein
MIQIRGLQKSFGASRVLRGIDLDIADGEVVALIGRSGCGKTTLLRCINFLEEYEAGEIRLDGEPLWYRAGADGARRRVSEAEARRQRQQMGIVFQQYNLFPHMTALDNVVLGPRFSQGVAPPDAEALGRRLLARVGLESKMAAYPAQLSGGQQQRVAVARALASRPELVFADEPTGNLDSQAGTALLRFLRRAVDEWGQSIVMVTHDQVAAGFADAVVRLADGRVVEPAGVAS